MEFDIYLLSYLTNSYKIVIMIAGVRQRLNSLSKDTKTIVLRVTMLFLLGVSILAIAKATWQQKTPQTSPYDTYLQQYVGKYGEVQQQFNRFVFYVTQENVIFSNKQLKENYYQEINSFADITEGEFQELYNIVTSVAKAKSYLEIAQFENNYYYDWADFIPPVKDMRDADASHIFAVTAAMEFEANKRKVLQYRQQNVSVDVKDDWITFSEQEVIDCCVNCREHPSPKYVYYHLKNYGISLNNKYPYVSSIYNPGPFNCKTNNSKKPFHLEDYYELSGCKALAERLEYGPIVVAVDSRGWRNYQGGIFADCSATVKRNHYALVVGRGIGYWKVRNSWGPRWGQRGHIRIKSGNSCGICSRLSYPELE